MNKQMNKQGGSFALGMVLVTIVLISVLWLSFVDVNKKIKACVSGLENLTAIYAASDRLELYLHEAARLSSHQSLYAIAADAAVDKSKECFFKQYGTMRIIQWTESCKPERAFLEQKFLSDYDSSFSTFLARYPEALNLSTSHAIENDTIVTTVKSLLSAEQRAAFAHYSLSYELDKRLELSLRDEQIYLSDFELIYNSITQSWNECRKNKSPDECIAEIKLLSFERWNLKVIKADEWLLFELATKKLFFFEEAGSEQFKPIELRFGISTS